MNRRDLLKLGATAAAVPVGIPAQPQAKPAVPWKPSVLDSHQDETVIALIDLIIPSTDTPGAKAALVNRHMDHLLRDEPEGEQERFVQGLGWIDGYAIRKYGKTFVRCAPAEQIAILEILDSNSQPGVAAGHRFFLHFKARTARLYYATQIGFAEMNKGGRVPASFGCKHPEHA